MREPQRSIRTADSTFSPKKRWPTLKKRSGALEDCQTTDAGVKDANCAIAIHG